MSDRYRNPSRAGLFSGEAQPDGSPGETADLLRDHTPSPHHPASLPPIDSPAEFTDRAHAVDKSEAKQLARTLKDIFQSLAGHPVSSPTLTSVAAPEEIAGVVTPSVEVPTASGRHAKPSDDGPGLTTESAPTGPVLGDSLAGGRDGVDSSARSELQSADRGEFVGTAALAMPLSVARDGEPTGQPASSADRPTGGETSEGLALRGPSFIAAEAALVGGAAVAIAVGGEPAPDFGRWSSSSDRATLEAATRGGVHAVAASQETIAVGPIGLVGRNDEGLDRASFASVAPTTWGGASGGDLFATGHGDASTAAEGPGGSDLGPTNALLVQILDELRRNSQASFIASGRSVYPER